MPPTAIPCVLTWTLRIRLLPAAVTVMGVYGLTPELPPAGEITGGPLVAAGFPAPAAAGRPLLSRPR